MPTAAAIVFLIGFGVLAAIVWSRWRHQQRELARVRATFARYVAPSVVDVILDRKDERIFTGREVRATVLVCRIRDFAHFIEPLSPDETLRYLNEFYALTGTAIQRHRGIIDTFLGDGVVAVFGVPLENPTQEDDALRAALDIVRHVVAMRKRWEQQHRKPFTVGIGVNTGKMIAGDAGFRDRREFTVVGTEATFAHHLQAAAFALNAFIVASRSTCETLTSEYRLVPLSGVPLPGVRRLLDAFVVRAREGASERFTVPVDAMIETQIQTPETPTPVSEAPLEPPALPPKPPPRTPAPALTPPRTAAQAALETAAIPDGWIFPQGDIDPIIPDPPAPRATYQDRGGSFEL